MITKDLHRLRAVTVLDDPTSEAWRLLDDAELGYTAFRILIAPAIGPRSVTAGSDLVGGFKRSVQVAR